MIKILYVFLALLCLPTAPISAYSYVKGGAVFIGEEIVAPMGGIGQRYDYSLFAFDLSWTIASSKKHKVAFYSSPRCALLMYINPMHSNRFYIGGAASWAYISNSKKNTGYSGLVGEVVAGLEFQSILCFRPFVEVSESFPYKRFTNRIGHIGHRASTSVVIGLGL